VHAKFGKLHCCLLTLATFRLLTILQPNHHQVGKQSRPFVGPNGYISPGECGNDKLIFVDWLATTNISGAHNKQEVEKLRGTMTVMAQLIQVTQIFMVIMKLSY
jgi:hypothetical protein